MASLVSMHTIDEAFFDASRRIVGWSSTPPTLSVASTSGATLVDRTIPSVRCIARVAVNAANVVAFLGVPSSAAQSETRLSIFFVVGCSLVHMSAQPFPWLHHHQRHAHGNNERSATCPMLKCMRIGGYDCCLVSARGAQHVALYCRQRPDLAEALGLEDELLLLEDGPFPGSAVCVLKNGKIIVVSCEETESAVKLESVTEVETAMLDIRHVRCAGRVLVWVLSGDGRLVAFRAVAPSSNAALDEGRHAADAVPSLSISRGTAFNLERVVFLQPADGGSACDGFTVAGSSQIWGDERSLNLTLVAMHDDANGVEVTRVAVDPNFSANVTAVVMHLDATRIVAFTVQNRTLDVLATHPRKAQIERVSLDVDSAIAANASNTRGEVHGMCSQVTWADHRQLGLLRTRCESLVDQLEAQSIALGSQEASRERIERLIGLQRAALAFLKREHTDTQCALGPENSVSHALLRRLRHIYVRLASHLFLLNVGVSAEQAAKPLSDALGLSNLRDVAAVRMQALKASFHETFALQPTLEHPRDSMERWGAGMQPFALAIDVFAREAGFDVGRVSLEQLIAQFPSASTTFNTTALALVLMYVANGTAQSRPEVAQHMEEFARILDVPVGLRSWATLMHVADTEAQNVTSSSSTGDDGNEDGAMAPAAGHWGHSLESCMPFVPKLLPTILDGLMCRGLFETALQVGRFALSVYPTGGIPNGFGSKVLMLAYRGGDAALIAQVAQSAMGTGLSKLAVHAVARVAEALNSLSVADGLYPVNSEEFHELESILEAQARQEASGSLLNAALLCELRLIAARYDATARYTSTFGVTPAHAQRFHAFREHLRAHLPDAPEGAVADSPQYQQRRGTRGATSPPVAPVPRRATTCLREPDEELNNAVRSTSTSNIAQRRAASARRPSTSAMGGRATYGVGGVSMGTHVAEDPLICGGAVGNGGKHCVLPRPCPYHDAGYQGQ